jgi:antitoxin (DNA-binding transcriptional repressor) of toxin-antitoxin stability system
MEKVTIEGFQKNFDEYLKRVENGESIIIEDVSGKSVVMVPADEEIIRIHTEHDDAS